jgi:DNA-binding HxlR family transcriptional regulator
MLRFRLSHAKWGYHLVTRAMVRKRKTRVTPPPSNCPLNSCMRLIGGAWTASVIWYLREGERCFTELQSDLQGISAKMLTSRLRRLERDGVVERMTKPTSPPTVWYALTPVGQELCAALTNVVEIAQRLKPAARASAAS